MKHLRFLFFAAFLLMIGSLPVVCQSLGGEDLSDRSQASSNVPSGKSFKKLLKRDLKRYFQEATVKRKVTIEYELLRNIPTQSGVAFPKFYLWVWVKEDDLIIEEGAVRVAAVAKKHFNITHYLKRADIERNPKQVYEVFPKAIGDRIVKDYADLGTEAF